MKIGPHVLTAFDTVAIDPCITATDLWFFLCGFFFFQYYLFEPMWLQMTGANIRLVYARAMIYLQIDPILCLPFEFL